MKRARFVLTTLIAVGAISFGTAAFGQGQTPSGPIDGARAGQAINRPAQPRVSLPPLPGAPTFSGAPGAQRVQPEQTTEERILKVTLRDGTTYEIPYTAEIQLEQTPDGTLHERVVIPVAQVHDAAARTLPPQALAQLGVTAKPGG